MYKNIIKKIWKKFIMIACCTFVICLGVVSFHEKKEKAEEKVEITRGSVMNFDITSFSHLGEEYAMLYDYTSVWNDSVLIDDYIQLLNKDKAISALANDWQNMSDSEKIQWIIDNIKVQRLSSSTMYRVTYTSTVPEKDKKQVENAADDIIKVFWQYATEISKMSDENLKYKEVKKIDIENAVTETVDKGNNVMFVLISAVLALMISITYFGIEVIKYKKKR